MLANRPDIRQAELELAAAALNIQVSRANFYPSFGLQAGFGYQAFNPKFLLNVYEYEQTILNAYREVVTQLSNIDNLASSYQLKNQQVEALTKSIAIANQLFLSARADYMEVLLTQRDAMEGKMELIETKKEQMSAMVNLYKSLGGGWR